MNMRTNNISIYCDGSANNVNQNCGTMGMAILFDGDDPMLWAAHSTIYGSNSLAEINAFYKALDLVFIYYIDRPLTIYSDSKYVVRSYNEWLDGWKQNNYVSSSKHPIAHAELWSAIARFKLENPAVIVEHVKGHSGHPKNSLVDLHTTYKQCVDIRAHLAVIGPDGVHWLADLKNDSRAEGSDIDMLLARYWPTYNLFDYLIAGTETHLAHPSSAFAGFYGSIFSLETY